MSITNEMTEFLESFTSPYDVISNPYLFYLVKALNYTADSSYVPSTGILEISASNAAPENNLEIGSYTPLKPFVLRATDNHTAVSDSLGTIVISLRKVTLQGESVVGTFTLNEGVGTLTLISNYVEIGVNDVLRFVVDSCPIDCDRVTITVSAYFA